MNGHLFVIHYSFSEHMSSLLGNLSLDLPIFLWLSVPYIFEIHIIASLAITLVPSTIPKPKKFL